MIEAAAPWIVSRKLICQVPVIHFQHDQSGATLRASAIKPKLDCFLHTKCAAMPARWQINPHSPGLSALNYKMHLTALDPDAKRGMPHRLFSSSQGRRANRLYVFGDVQLDILCMDEALKQLIEAHIDEFFVVSNFGAMQSKGFGSYITEQSLSHGQIAAALCRHTGAPACYVLSGYTDIARVNPATQKESTYKSHVQMLDDIKKLYADMKRHYLPRYFREVLHIGSESTKLKLDGIVPVLTDSFQQELQQEYRYVRALFGTSVYFRYITQQTADGKLDYHGEKYALQISHPKIRRFPSPIFFKIIENDLYIIARRIHPSIYGQSFRFSGNKGSVTLNTPEEGLFDIDAFMAWFVQQYACDQAAQARDNLIDKPIETLEVLSKL